MELEKRLNFGMAGVDWEERINFDRMRKERLQKTKDTMAKYGFDAAFVQGENVRYALGMRTSMPH